MRPLSRMIAIATVSVWMAIHANPAGAQTFDDRWSIIPKAHAEPAPEGLDQTKEDEPHAQPPIGQEPTRDSKVRSGTRSFNRVFSGKASFYSYEKGKTASGFPFNRDSLTAAHRSLPFGTLKCYSGYFALREVCGQSAAGGRGPRGLASRPEPPKTDLIAAAQ